MIQYIYDLDTILYHSTYYHVLFRQVPQKFGSPFSGVHAVPSEGPLGAAVWRGLELPRGESGLGPVGIHQKWSYDQQKRLVFKNRDSTTKHIQELGFPPAKISQFIGLKNHQKYPKPRGIQPEMLYNVGSKHCGSTTSETFSFRRGSGYR